MNEANQEAILPYKAPTLDYLDTLDTHSAGPNVSESDSGGGLLSAS